MTRIRWSKRLVLATAASLVVITGSVWFVESRGGLVNLLHLPPVRDSSTPAAQNGLTLAAITLSAPGPDGLLGFQFDDANESMRGVAGVWIEDPQEQGSPAVQERSDFQSKLFNVTARTSVGDVFSPDWRMTSNQRYGLSYLQSHNYLLIALPSGYSDGCRWIDLSVATADGHTSRWRITRLPHMKQILPRPIVVQDRVTTHGITVSADAWRSQNGLIWFRLCPVLPPNTHQWDFNFTGSWLEYEPFDYHTDPTETSHSHPIQARNGVFKDDFEKYQKGIIGGIRQAPYHSSSRFIRFTCELRQFETYDEIVTFHDIDIARDANDLGDIPNSEAAYYFNITRPQTITTPSGIQVTLPAQGKTAQMFGGGINIVFQVQPSQPLNSLPRSPLMQAYGKPVSLDYVFPPPFEVETWRIEPGPLHHYQVQYNKYPYPSIYPKRLKNFSIIIRQRVDLQTIPMTFTVPVVDPKPSPPQKPKTP